MEYKTDTSSIASPALLLKINAGLSWQLLHCRAVSGIGSWLCVCFVCMCAMQFSRFIWARISLRYHHM